MNKDNLSSQPFISVVIPAFNEEKYISRAIRSLLNQDFKKPYEIIVVDNNSKDKTSEIAGSFGVRVVFEQEQGLPAARQRGLAEAKGEIVAYLDADSIAPSKWLRLIDEFFDKDKKVVAISGPASYNDSNKKSELVIGNLCSKIISFLSRSIRKILRKGDLLQGANFAARKSALLEIKGFNKDIKFWGEDTELSMRLLEVGKIKFVNELIIQTSFRRFAQKDSKEISKNFFTYVIHFFKQIFFYKFINRAKHPLGACLNYILKSIFQYRYTLFYGSLIIIGAMIFFAVNPRSGAFGEIYANSGTELKQIALTFDDGPNEPYTGAVLEILKQNNIKATFFVVGKNVEYYPAALKKIFNEGHIIANHSYSHSLLLPIGNREIIRDEVNRTEDLISEIIGLKTRLFRPAYTYKSPWLLEEVKAMGYSVITWDDRTDDTDRNAEKIVQRIVKKAEPGGIIVLHDGNRTKHGYEREELLEALPKIINLLKADGYQFLTVPELLKIPAYK